MSRRRSADPTESIRITIPRSIHHGILDILEPSASRSAWIAGACRDKLIGSTSLDDASSKQLAVVLFNRGAITQTMYDLITDHVAVVERRNSTS